MADDRDASAPTDGRTLLVGAVADALDVDIVRAERVRGGDVAEAFRLVLADGSSVFAKTHLRPPANFFSTEAWGLRWLGEVAGIRVPRVLAVSDGGTGPAFLALGWIDERGGPPRDERAFGRSLADLHRSGAPCFGREDRRTTGSRALPNDPCGTWVEFYARCRLLPLARLGHDTGALPAALIRGLEAVAARLDRLGGPPEPPARLHGDLWAGNRIVDATGESWLVDPAAHGGHREFDLAMMRLFGGFGAGAFEAYHEVHPLAAGWEERIALHQLAPLTVHAIKFGGGYVDATERAVSSLR